MLCEHPPYKKSSNQSLSGGSSSDEDVESYKPQPLRKRLLFKRASMARLEQKRRTGKICMIGFCIGMIGYLTIMNYTQNTSYYSSSSGRHLEEGAVILTSLGHGKGIPFSTQTNMLFSNSIVYKHNQMMSLQDTNTVLRTNDAIPSDRMLDEDNVSEVNDIRSKEVAYVIVVTECGSEPLWDGAAVLGRTVQLVSYSSNYGYKLYAIMSQDAAATAGCADKYAKVGYEVLVRPVPVVVSNIQPGHYATNVEARCNHMKDFLHLEAWTLGEKGHDIVVLTDVKTMFIQPLDELYDSMLFSKDTSVGDEARRLVKHHWMQYGLMEDSQRSEAYRYDFPDDIQAYFTKDYTVVHPIVREKAGVQTGLVVIKPNMDHYHQMLNIIKEGAWGDKDYMGWYNLGYGAYPRGMCTKGLLSLFYTHVLPKNQQQQQQPSSGAVELDRCYYNAVSDTHITKSVTPTENNNRMNNEGVCRDGRLKCDDCRSVVSSLQELKTVNTSICRRPWTCHYHSEGIQYDHTFKLCRDMTHEWFTLRYQVEQEFASSVEGYVPAEASGSFGVSYFLGYCDGWGQEGYLPMNLPNSIL